MARAIKAESVIRLRRDGEAPDPNLVWIDLCQSPTGGWPQADLFRQHLDLELGDVIPRGGPGADHRPERELVKVRTDTGKELAELMTEWLVVAHPEPQGGA